MTVAFNELTITNSDAAAVTTTTVNAASAGGSRCAIILLTTGGADIDGGAAVTVGGVAATLLTGINNRFSAWYFVSPPLASAAYVGTWTASVRCVMYVATFTGVRQSSPVRQEQTASPTSVSTSTLTFSASLPPVDMLFDIVQKSTNEDIVPAAGQTERSDTFYANNAMRQALSTKPVAIVSETTGWTWATNNDTFHNGFCLAASFTGSYGLVMIFAERWRGFLHDLRVGLIPPQDLRRRYREVAI